MSHVTIIGGGITGLATAYYLQEKSREKQQSVQFSLIEAGSDLGGKIATDEVDGFVIEGGPDSFVTYKPWLAQLCRDLGIEDHMLPMNSGHDLYVMQKGELVPFPVGFRLAIPSGIRAIAGSQLISWRGKLRMAMEPFIKPRKDTSDESLGAFIRRRLGQEALDKLGGPMMAGIYMADPNLVPDARKLDEIGFEEMLELASYGAKMNPRSIELGMVYNVPILVASSFSNTPGTLIHRGGHMDEKVGEIRNRVRGIATDTNVAKITVRNLVDRPGIAARVFEPLADADVSVDVIVQNASVDGATDLTFTVNRTDLDRAMEVVEAAVQELEGEVLGAGGLAKVTIVGTGMQDASGYASKMFRALADAGINIEMISTSEIRITCLVDESRVGDAAQALHVAFALEEPD